MPGALPSGNDPDYFDLGDFGIVGAGLTALTGRTQSAVENFYKAQTQNSPGWLGASGNMFAGLFPDGSTPFPVLFLQAIMEQILQYVPGGTIVIDLLSELGDFFGEFWSVLTGGSSTGTFGLLDDVFDFFTNLPQDIAAIVDAIFEAITGLVRNPLGDPLSDLFDVLRNIPFLNILGIGGPPNIGSSLQGTWDNLIGGLVGAIGSGSGLADIFNIAQDIASRATLGLFSWDILGIRSNKPFWGGLLPTGVSNAPLPLHTSTAPTFALTQSTATMSFHHIIESSPLGAVSWNGIGPLTSITDFFVNIYKMASDGVLTLVHQSANIIGDLNPALSTSVYTLPTPLATVATETYATELAIRGAGTYNIVGYQTWLPNHPTTFPRNLAAVRNSGTSAPPPTIASGSVNYSTNVPVVEIAVSGGEFNNHEPILRQYLASGTSTIPIASWANFVEVVTLGGGGGGHGGGFLTDGNGGGGGHWTTATWVRNTDFTGTPTILINVAAGGAGGAFNDSGANGGSTVVSITGQTVTATGGIGATGVNSLGDYSGHSPGNTTYGSSPVPPPYVGGGTQGSYGGAGASPGGGGAGGMGLIAGSGGNGASGAAWIRFRQ